MHHTIIRKTKLFYIVAAMLIFCTSAFAFDLKGMISGKKESETFDLNKFAEDKKGVANVYVKIEKADGIKGVKKIFIPSFQVEFITKSSASASSYVMGKSASSSVSYSLVGLDEANLQILTDYLYDEFVKDLEGMGIIVITANELLANPVFQEIMKSGEKSPSHQKSRLEPKAGETIVFTPHGLPFYFTVYDPKAGFSALGQLGAASSANAPHNLEGRLIDELGAAMMKVRLVAGFAEVKASSSMGKYASQTGTMHFTIAPKGSEILIGDKFDSWEGGFGEKKTKSYMLRHGDMAKISLLQPIVSNDPIVKEIQDKTGKAAKVAEGVFNVLSAVTGTGSMTREYAAIVDAPVYESAGKQYLNVVREMFLLKMKESL
ncbi:MAG: hypothetical protein JW943_11300 [Deltaproteobacteria bacterium]|nr:hypothetical protein [Deltaproteobacteria bacterium]